MSMVYRLIEQLKNRGLSIQLGEQEGQLLLCGPTSEKTSDVIAAVKKFKPKLMEIYGKKGHQEQVAKVREEAAKAGLVETQEDD